MLSDPLACPEGKSSPVRGLYQRHLRLQSGSLSMARTGSTTRPASSPIETVIDPAHRTHLPRPVPRRDVNRCGSPGAVVYTIFTPGPSHQIKTLPTGGLQMFTVSQAFPGARSVKHGPVTVIIIVLMVTPREMRLPARGDQQPTGDGCGGPPSFFQPVRTGFAVHVA